MKTKINYILLITLGILAGVIGTLFLPNFSGDADNNQKQTTLYTCGMHPEIIEKEPGNCPICGMRLQPLKQSGKSSDGERKILYWRAPMNPNEIYDKPGKSKMGMDLVPVYEDEAEKEGAVTVDGSVMQSMNVRTEKITRRNLATEINTYGITAVNEKRKASVTMKFDGWITKLHVSFIGEKIRKGQAIAEIYSPAIAAAEQEITSAIASGNKNEINRSTKKLRLLGVPQREINRLLRTKKPHDTFTFYADFTGTITKLNVLEGDKFSANKSLFEYADLTSLWLLADVYATDLTKINNGDSVLFSLDAFPSEKFRGAISYVYPIASPETQTVKVRAEIPNKNGKLLPGMFAEVTIKSAPKQNVPSVPENAVIRSGRKNIVIVVLGDGKFKPVEIKLGIYSDGFYEIKEGLKENDVIVSSGQFLIDSESNLRAALDLFSSSANSQEASANKMQNENPKTHTEHNSIVREGEIDVAEIDKNGDGKVFQDPMDWNVISDKPGRCPLCGMFLKEYSIEQAERNLVEHGFRVKKHSHEKNNAGVRNVIE